MQSRTTAIARWLAPVCFAAPAFIWTAFALDGSSALDPLAFGLGAAFLVAQMARAVLIAFDYAIGFSRTARRDVATRMAVWITKIRSLHLGMRRKFLALLALNFILWGIVIALLAVADDPQAVPIVAAVAGLTATLGWMFSTYITARNTQRQNTITLLLNLRHSEVYSRHFNNAYFISLSPNRDDHAHWFSLDRKATWKTSAAACAPADDPQSAITVRSAYQSVIYVLNYFEFIAAGVRSNALDAGIVRDTISGHLRGFSKTFAAWIAAEREGSANAYEHLKWYCEKFPARS